MTEESILLHPDPGAAGAGGLREFIATTRLQLRSAFKHCHGQLFRRRSILLLTLLLLQVCILVLQKCITIRMVNYPYVLAQTQPMCTTLLFMVLYLITNVYVRRKAEKAIVNYPSPPTEHMSENSSIQRLRMKAFCHRWLISCTATLVPEPVPFPKYKFLAMGVLFTLANFMLFAGDLIPGPISLLLQQAVIPLSFALSFVFLGTRYRLPHYIGALIVLLGIGLCLWPQLDTLGHFGTVFWAVLLILGSASCTAAALILMEHSFKQCNMQLYYAWVWINVFEIFAALPLVFAIIPIQSFAHLPDQGISIKDIPENVLDGYMCLVMRHNSQSGDECQYGYLFALVANKVNLAYVVKYHSATQMWTAVTCAIPLANLAFCMHFIMGSHTSKFEFFPLVALGIVFIGLLIYRSTKEKQFEQPEAGEKSFWYEYPTQTTAAS